MSKEKVLAEFQVVFRDPRSEDGVFLYENLLNRARSILISDRAGLVEALRLWISLRDQVHANTAVIMAGDLAIKELKPDLQRLREDIISRKAFPTNYTGWVDKALEAIE
jgi:hypothetical protein